MKNIKLGLLVMVIAGALFTFTGCGGKKANLNDYVTYEFDGYDGLGNVKASFDSSKLAEDIGELDDAEFDGMGMIAIESIIDGGFDTTEYLSNGDSIQYKWDISDDYAKQIKKKLGVKLKYSDFKVKVEGLKDPSEFDVAERLTIEVSGIAPNGKLQFACNLKGLDYDIDKKDGLSNGDEVTITFKPTDSSKTMAEVCKENKVPEFDSTYKYTVEGLHALVSNPKEIPEKELSAMEDAAEQRLDQERKDCNCETAMFPGFNQHTNWDSYKLVALAAGSRPGSTPSNGVALIYEVNYSKHGDVTRYVYVFFDNITDDPDETEFWAKMPTPVSQVDGRTYYGKESVEELESHISDKLGHTDDLVVEYVDGTEAKVSENKTTEETETKKDEDNKESSEDKDASESKDASAEKSDEDPSSSIKGSYSLSEESWEEYGMDLILEFKDSNSGTMYDGDLKASFKKNGNSYTATYDEGRSSSFTIKENSDGSLSFTNADGTFTLVKR